MSANTICLNNHIFQNKNSEYQMEIHINVGKRQNNDSHTGDIKQRRQVRKFLLPTSITKLLNFHFISSYHDLHYLTEHAVAQLVEALRYKPEGREFDSRWRHWNFSST